MKRSQGSRFTAFKQHIRKKLPDIGGWHWKFILFAVRFSIYRIDNIFVVMCIAESALMRNRSF